MQSSLSDNPDWRSAIDLAAALRRRETSAAETLEAVLERADRVGPVLNAFSVRLDPRAREAARAWLCGHWAKSKRPWRSMSMPLKSTHGAHCAGSGDRPPHRHLDPAILQLALN